MVITIEMTYIQSFVNQSDSHALTYDESDGIRYVRISGLLCLVSAVLFVACFKKDLPAYRVEDVLFVGGVTMLGIAMLLGKTFLPKDISERTPAEFIYGSLVTMVCFISLLTIASVLLGFSDTHQYGLNLIPLVLAELCILMVSRTNGENIRRTTTVFTLSLLIVAVYLGCVFLSRALSGGWFVNLTFIPLLLSMISLDVAVMLNKGRIASCVVERDSREPYDIPMYGKRTVFAAVSLLLFVPLVLGIMELCYPWVDSLVSRIDPEYELAPFAVLAAGLLPSAHIIGSVLGFLLGLYHAFSRRICPETYAESLWIALMIVIILTAILISVPLFVLYGITYLVALAMVLGVYYVITRL